MSNIHPYLVLRASRFRLRWPLGLQYIGKNPEEDDEEIVAKQPPQLTDAHLDHFLNLNNTLIGPDC